jgi:hypothetical protein
MPTELVVRIIAAVASALDYAHKQGLLHRDIKPANIMLTTKDDDHEQRILLTDFGIARNVGDISGLTATNMTVGTVAYSAPEQLMGEQLDGRADQYALAATAYHLLTATQLFPHSNPAVVISRHLNAEPPSVSTSRPELSAMDSVLTRALAKDPGDRFTRCTDFAQALAETTRAEGPSSAAPTLAAATAAARPALDKSITDRPRIPADKTAGRSSRRFVIAGAAIAAVVAVAIAAVVWRPWQHNRPSPASAAGTRQPAPSIIPAPVTTAPQPPPTSLPSQESPVTTAPTDVQTTVAVVNGQSANGFREVLNTVSAVLSGCDIASPAAVTPNVHVCHPSAAGTDVCWAAPPASMLCLDDPWAKGLRRFAFDTAYLSQVQPVAYPQPYALLLDDGTRCRFMYGGARGGRPDGYLPAYNCGTAGSGLSVLMGPDASDPIDRSTPLWTVKVAALGSAPQTRSVTTAWFAGT